jgi:hypothetical protein
MASDVGFDVFKARTMKNAVFHYVTPCGSCKNRRFEGKCCFFHQGENISKPGKRWFFSSWWWRRQVPPKRRFSYESQGVTYQKTAFFMLMPQPMQVACFNVHFQGLPVTQWGPSKEWLIYLPEPDEEKLERLSEWSSRPSCYGLPHSQKSQKFPKGAVSHSDSHNEDYISSYGRQNGFNRNVDTLMTSCS